MTLVPLSELPEFVRNVRAALKLMPLNGGAMVVFLEGDLGAGKTTFVQQLGRELGVHESMQSPTYVLMKKYELEGERTNFGQLRRFKRLVHIDAYRLESPEQFQQLKPETFLNDPDALVVIEWPEKIEGQILKPDMIIKFSAEGVPQNERTIEMSEK